MIKEPFSEEGHLQCECGTAARRSKGRVFPAGGITWVLAMRLEASGRQKDHHGILGVVDRGEETVEGAEKKRF